MRILLIATLLLGTTFAFSQQVLSKQETQKLNSFLNRDPLPRYGKDYRLVDESIITADSSFINQIRTITIDVNRKKSEDVIYHHPKLDVEILIYSEEYCIANGYEYNKVRPVNLNETNPNPSTDE